MAAVRRHIEATLGPGDQLLLSTRMVSTSNAFEVRGEGEVATFPRFVLCVSVSVVMMSLCCAGVCGGAAGSLSESRGRAGGHPGQDHQHPDLGVRGAAATLLDTRLGANMKSCR